MIAITILLLVTAADAEEPPLGISLRPPTLELPPRPERVKCEEDMTRFNPDPVPLLENKVVAYKDADEKYMTWTLRPGILMSECGFVDHLNVLAEHKAMQAELNAVVQWMNLATKFWSEAETQYQTRIVELEEDVKDAREPTLWDEIKTPLAFFLGAAVTVGLIFGTAEIIKAMAKWNEAGAVL